MTDALNIKADAPKRKREFSEVEKDKIENRRQVSNTITNLIDYYFACRRKGLMRMQSTLK